ncbi:MAG: UDPGP type 1 family protein [Verrucomicrobiales bacterium]|nr:UDPGP type 1 family protein [Verrucomicrobiales bacterium]
MNPLRQHFEDRGQGQVFRFFDQISSDQQEQLIRQANAIDLDEIDTLVENLLKSSATQEAALDLQPANYLPVPCNRDSSESWQKAHAIGSQALNDGKVAAFTVAGGQGTRLGFAGPKGTFPISPVSGKTLFQIFAEKIAASEKQHQCTIPWFIMTSEGNHQDTLTFFEENHWFSLSAENIHLFPQGTLPAVDQNGKILLEDKHRIALSPDGHGGSLRALVRSGATQRMADQGIEILSCFQVDNPLVQCIDPTFIGFHLEKKSTLSSKTIMKTNAGEKVGVFCQQGEQTCVVEYSDMSQELQQQTESDGSLSFRAGSIAVHLFDRQLIEQLGGDHDSVTLPFHLARKKISALDKSGQPSSIDGIKFEMFIFDALPFAQSPMILETLREEEFSPVKNAQGNDSPESSKQDQLKQFARWLAAVGIQLPTDDKAVPTINIEISPSFADCEEGFIKAWNNLPTPPKVKDGTILS